jgi:hypothetical protein
MISQPNENNSLPTDAAQLSRQLNLPTVELSPAKIGRLLLTIIVIITLASLLEQAAVYLVNTGFSKTYTAKLFNVDYEGNIPSIYSAINLGISSLLLGIISCIKPSTNHRYRRHWKFLSLLFLYLAFDEACGFHELLNSPFRSALKADGFLHFTWVVPAFILLIFFLLSFWRFVRSLPAKIQKLFMQAVTVYVSGAIGMELIGGYLSNKYGEYTMNYILVATCEEFLEMVGIAIFIYALLLYIKLHTEKIELSICLNNYRA